MLDEHTLFMRVHVGASSTLCRVLRRVLCSVDVGALCGLISVFPNHSEVSRADVSRLSVHASFAVTSESTNESQPVSPPFYNAR